MTTSRSIRTFNRSEHGATLVEHAILVCVIVIVCTGAIMWLNKHQGNNFDKKPNAQKAHAPVVKMIYRGNVLSCSDFSLVDDVGGTSLTCDFVDFYASPQKATKYSQLPVAVVIKNTYYGHTVYCPQLNEKHSGTDWRRLSCDYERYYQDLRGS